MRIEDFLRLPPDTDLAEIAEMIEVKKTERAQLAEDVLKNEAFQHAYLELRAYLLNQWENTQVDDTYRRECLWKQIQCAQMFFENIRVLMETGKIARMNLDLKERNSKVRQMLKNIGM